MSVKMRRHIERKIARRLIMDAIHAGYSISVFDCEEFTLKHSVSVKDIMGAMFTTDDDRLYVSRDGKNYCGWVWFIYGNSGYDVISDYTTNLEPLMEGCNKLADLYE